MNLNPSDQYRTREYNVGRLRFRLAKAEPGNWARSMSGVEVAVNTKYVPDIYGSINAKK
jgi:hypothetical protein